MAEDAKNQQLFVVELKAEPPGHDRHGIEPVVRLRRLLKKALRGFGLRAVRIEQKGVES